MSDKEQHPLSMDTCPHCNKPVRSVFFGIPCGAVIRWADEYGCKSVLHHQGGNLMLDHGCTDVTIEYPKKDKQ